MELVDIIGEDFEGSPIIIDSFQKALSVINDPHYMRILSSISGGGDSDVMLDICHRVDVDKKIKYVWFDTGIEYQATKDHIDFLEKKYDITIDRESPMKTIPQCCREYGQPFISKFVSEAIGALQRHGFTWTDEPYEVLAERYPKITSYIKWWCNAYQHKKGYERLPKQFNINYNRWLKEFMIENPPTFSISKKCCDYAKKNVSKHLIKLYNADLMITGVRKAEGGIRSKSYQSCFTEKENASFYRPLFWYKDADKKEYEQKFCVTHSACYTEYGFTRTGCAGCPYNHIKLEEDLKSVEIHEPKLFVAINNIFKDTYAYTRAYKVYCQQRNKST